MAPPRTRPLLFAAVAAGCGWGVSQPLAWVAGWGKAADCGPAPRLSGAKAIPCNAQETASDTGRSSLLVGGGAAAALAVVAAATRSKSSAVARAAKKEGGVQQLLGMKGASDEEVPLWKIRLQLCKPVTWPPLVLGCIAGAAASGTWEWDAEHGVLLACAMFISGPCFTGFTQTINDWYDKDIDAINEPYRPIPSGKITEAQVWEQIYGLLGLGMVIALGLDLYVGHLPNGLPTVTMVAILGCFLAYIYSAPPLKLKVNGWSGGYALGWSYVSLPWWCTQALFGELTPEIIALTTFYSIGAIGIAVVNDFKSMEGDAKLGLDSIPVMYGLDNSKYLSSFLMDSVQLCVAAWLYSIGETTSALGLCALIVPQFIAQKTLLWEDPIANDVKTQASSLPFFQFGIILTAMAIGSNPYH